MNGPMRKEVEKLKERILELGAVVEESVAKATRSFVARDAELARQVIDDDYRIDQMEVDLEEEGLKSLALYQPVAIDLRLIVAVLRINSDLERIGDLAVNLAERSAFLCTQDPLTIPGEFSVMAEKAELMLKKSLDALVNLDPVMARAVIVADDEVDRLNRTMYRTTYDSIRARPDKVESHIHILSACRHLERIADHATNIAEDVIYMTEGEIVRHKPEDFAG